MPGIFGLIGEKPIQESREVIAAMAGSMSHESSSSYSSGVYSNESLGVCIGWTSLGGSFSDCMPIWNEQKDICLFLTGEVFADSEELSGLRRDGHQLNPEDARYLVDLYEEHGCAFLERLNGLFA